MEPAEYDRMAALEASLWWYRALHVQLLERLALAGLREQARLLDAGCGTGGFLTRLKAARPDLSPEGLELDMRAASIARGKTGLTITEGSIAEMPYRSSRFSAIVSADVLCHTGVDEPRALSEFHRCLESGGLLVLSLPAYDWLRSAHDDRVQTAHRYTARQARDLVRGAGFARVEVTYWNGLLFPLMLLHRVAVGRGPAESDVRPFPPWQDSLFFSILQVERRCSSLGLRVPFGGSVQVEARK